MTKPGSAPSIPSPASWMKIWKSSNPRRGKCAPKATILSSTATSSAPAAFVSIARIFRSALFRALGLSEEQLRRRFGFFLDALTYGTPPHGGIALGIDRIAMLLAGEKSLREVIAFAKTTAAVDLMAESPSTVDKDQLDQLGIAIKE